MCNIKRIIVIGCGGHAKVVLDALQTMGTPADALVIEESQREQATSLAGLFDVKQILTDRMLLAGSDRQSAALVNGVGSVADTLLRKRIHETFLAAGFRFAEVIHPSAVVSRHAQLDQGAQIMAGAILHAGASIGANVIINTGALVDHDCCIGAHTHVAPAAALSGGVQIGQGCHIGTGACIIQGVQIGDGCVIGAGAVVIRNVESNQTVVGVPARVIRS